MIGVRLRILVASCLLMTGWILPYHTAKSECSVLKLSGSSYHSNTDGLYFLDGNNLCNSRHIWIQESGDHFIYYVLDGYDGWTIGSWSCYWGEFAMTMKSPNEEPFDIPGVWKEFADDVSLWRNNSDLQITCYDDVKYKDESDCQTTTCQHGGSCSESSDSGACICRKGYYGRFCEAAIDANHCRSSPCQNGAACVDLVNDFECKCRPGYSGRQCEFGTDSDGAGDGDNCDFWFCNEQCSKYDRPSCYTVTSFILIICGAVGVVILVIFIMICIARCIYMRQQRSKADNLLDDANSWKDVSYKRLESLDSVYSIDQVGI